MLLSPPLLQAWAGTHCRRGIEPGGGGRVRGLEVGRRRGVGTGRGWNRGRRVGFCKFWLCSVAKKEGEMLFQPVFVVVVF